MDSMRTKDFHGIPSVRHEALHWTKMLERHQGGPPATNTLTHTAHQLMRWSSVYLSLVYRDPGFRGEMPLKELTGLQTLAAAK